MNNNNNNSRNLNGSQKLNKEIGRAEYRRTSLDHPNYSITKIGLNTEKSPGDLRRLAITRTPEEDHQLMLVWKTCKE